MIPLVIEHGTEDMVGRVIGSGTVRPWSRYRRGAEEQYWGYLCQALPCAIQVILIGQRGLMRGS